MRMLTTLSFMFVCILALCQIAHAEEGILWIQVSNPLGQPIPDVVLSTAGPSSTSAPTDAPKEAQPNVAEVAGKVRIKLASSTRSGDEVELVIVRASQDLVVISPWHQRVTVPCFDNNTRCVAKVVLAERGSRMLLEYPQAQLALAAKVNAANAATASKDTSAEWQRQANLAEVAKAYGYAPEEVDKAIRSLKGKTIDSYQLGQVALYERNYPEAEKQLLKSKAERREQLERARGEMANSSSSLGQAYYEQGKYREAVKEYKEAAALRPSDSSVLNRHGVALYDAGQYAEAEESYQQSLRINEKALGAEHPDVVTSLNNLATLYAYQGRYAELYKRALSILEKQLGPEHPNVAIVQENYASLLLETNRTKEAEKLEARAKAIQAKQK